MGETTIDVAGVKAVAAEFDSVNKKLQEALDELNGLSFGATSAGKIHTDKGTAVHDGLRTVVAHLTQWKRANEEIANQLRATAERYDAAEKRNAAQVKATGATL